MRLTICVDFHILDFADSHPSPCAFFSLDAEKAFDRLEWNYMWAFLQCFGLGEHLISMIKTLYHSPAASVITGNIISGERGRDVRFPPYCFVYLLNPKHKPSGNLKYRFRFMIIIIVFHYTLMILFFI